jgi:hypothetical protein
MDNGVSSFYFLPFLEGGGGCVGVIDYQEIMNTSLSCSSSVVLLILQLLVL